MMVKALGVFSFLQVMFLSSDWRGKTISLPLHSVSLQLNSNRVALTAEERLSKKGVPGKETRLMTLRKAQDDLDKQA